jgi:hypothetical protein
VDGCFSDLYRKRSPIPTLRGLMMG